MIAEVTPLIKLPRTTYAFDYTIPQEMAKGMHAGQGVLISFRNKKSVQGIIVALKEKPFKKGIPLKPIKKILPLTLHTWQMSMAQWLAAYYHCSLSTALKMVLR